MPVPSSAPSDDVLRALHERHAGNIFAISVALGRPESTISKWLRRLGLRGTGRGGVESSAPPEDELRALYARHAGVFEQMAKALGVPPSTLRKWCLKLGLRGTGRDLYASVYPQQVGDTVRDGYVVIFSDAHLWFDQKSRAHEALLVALRRLKPEIVIANGDILDGARISRHDPSGVDLTPTLADELDVVKRHMAELARLAKNSRRYFTLGNHDSRLSRYLANHAPELHDVDGSRLDHHILGWEFCVSVLLNDDVMVKHIGSKQGIHATRNNALNDGRTIVCGHLHSQKVTPLTDAHGTRYGVDLGCLAETDWPQFNYTMNNVKDWRSGFGVIEFRDGRLLPPMLASVLDDGSVNLQRNETLLDPDWKRRPSTS